MTGLLVMGLVQAIPNGFFWPSLPWGYGVLWVGAVQGEFSSTNPAEYGVLANLPGVVDQWNSVFWTGYPSEPLVSQNGMDSSVLHIPVMKDYDLRLPGQTDEIAAGQDTVSGFMIYAKAVVYLNPSKLAWTSTIPPGKFDGQTVLRHELGHALGLGDNDQCHGLLMCGHHRDPGPHPIDADAMRGVYCL